MGTTYFISHLIAWTIPEEDVELVVYGVVEIRHMFFFLGLGRLKGGGKVEGGNKHGQLWWILWSIQNLSGHKTLG